jgi:membrane associated rhomboid family serine protease
MKENQDTEGRSNIPSNGQNDIEVGALDFLDISRYWTSSSVNEIPHDRENRHDDDDDSIPMGCDFIPPPSLTFDFIRNQIGLFIYPETCGVNKDSDNDDDDDDRTRTMTTSRDDSSYNSEESKRSTDIESNEVNEKQPCQDCRRRFPIFAVTMTLLIWIMYLWGVYGVIGAKNTTVGAYGPMSPPIPAYIFRAVDEWPSCGDVRGQGWRLFTSQIVHNGPLHIAGNTAGILFYGSFLELLNFSPPWLSSLYTLIVFEVGHILGNLAELYVQPYDFMVGSSPGMYSIVGYCLAKLIFNWKDIHPVLHWIVPTVIFIHLLVAAVLYFDADIYDPTQCSFAHCVALYVGLFLGLSRGITRRRLWMKVTGAFGICCFLVLSVSLIVNYAAPFPPRMLSYNPTFHPYSMNSCCGQMYSIVNATFPIERAREVFICNGYSAGTEE